MQIRVDEWVWQGNSMLVVQRAYVRLLSDELSFDRMTEPVGVPPTEGIAKGSRQSEPPILPRLNHWILESGVSDRVPVNQHFAALFPVLKAAAPRVREFTAQKESCGSVRVARHFSHEKPRQPESKGGALPLVRIGRHPILGFELDIAKLELLASLRFEFNVDEDE
jgi:hypothetical protein